MTRGKRAKSEPVPPTREEIIEHSSKRLRERFASREIALPTRSFAVGQKANLGGLVEPVVVEIRDNGRIIILEHTVMSRPDHTGKRQPIGKDWGAFWWFEVFPISDYEGFQYAKRSAWNNYYQTGLDSFIMKLCREEYRDNPDYQREYVWTLDDKVKFIDSIFSGRELGRFVFVEYNWPDNETEILDGKQRLQALKEFLFGGFQYSGRYWHEFSPGDRSIVKSTMVQYVDLNGSQFKRSELLEIFLEVNAAGVPQSEEHLSRVRQLYWEAVKQEGQ